MDSAKVNINFDIDMHIKPRSKEYLTPSMSMRYPEIVRPNVKRKSAETQNKSPASD